MKILVFGECGMLGTEVVEAGRRREHQMLYNDYGITNGVSLDQAYEKNAPDVIINCAGVIPSRRIGDVHMVNVNATGPHMIAEWFKDIHIIQVSTDCVFSGSRVGPHRVTDRPDPVDLYGRSKLAGELTGEWCTTVRTSFIGYRHGLLPWFLSQKGPTVPGWVNALWTGSTVYEVARQLIQIAEGKPLGLVHLAAPLLSKYELLCALGVAFDKDIKIVPTDEPYIYRDLMPTIRMPDIHGVLGELVERRP